MIVAALTSRNLFDFKMSNNLGGFDAAFASWEYVGKGLKAHGL